MGQIYYHYRSKCYTVDMDYMANTGILGLGAVLVVKVVYDYG